MNKPLKPPFSYYGGKQRVASKIIPLIPKHTVYCEPFAGGASILFKKPWPKITNSHNYREVINDTNFLVYNFYKQLRYNSDELIRLCSLTPYSKEEHSKCIEICKNPIGYMSVELARAFWFNINVSFSNKLNSGFGRSIYGRNISYSYYTKIENLHNYLNRMQSVTVENLPAIECIDKWDSPQTFFYLDPPYVDTNQGHYGGYTQYDLNRLISKLKEIQGSFILSGYSNSSYHADWENFRFDSICSASGKGKVGNKNKSEKCTDLGDRKRTEIALRHISRLPVRKEIQALYDSGQFDCFV